MEELRQRIVVVALLAAGAAELLRLLDHADIDHRGAVLGHQTREVRQPGDPEARRAGGAAGRARGPGRAAQGPPRAAPASAIERWCATTTTKMPATTASDQVLMLPIAICPLDESGPPGQCDASLSLKTRLEAVVSIF